MAVETISGVPCKFRSGDTIIFTVINPKYPPSAWSAQLLMQRKGTSVSAVNATESGDTYTFTLSAATTATYAPGSWQWAIRYTETASSQVETGESGTLDVLPNLGTSATASTAQTMLTAIEATITTLSSNQFTSASFNGQSVTFADLGRLIAQRDKLRAEVLSERRAAALAAGQSDGTLYQVRFQNPWSGC